MKIKNLDFKFLAAIVILNSIIPLCYLYLSVNPKQGFFGSATDFVYILIWFPALIFLISFLFETWARKLYFNLLSIISVFAFLINELFKTNFDAVIVKLLILYLIFPLVSVLLGESIVKISHKLKTK